MDNQIVHIDLGKRSYDITIGYKLDQVIKDFITTQKFSSKGLLITDSNLAPLYGEYMEHLLENAGLDIKLAVIPAGESSKSLHMAESLYTIAIEHGLDRKSPIFALGGGVVGDLAGFIAATFMRGVPFIQMPTSLLAQVDSSVGGKVAINHALGKNLIGAFYQPKAVFIDLELLKSLPTREISTGLGEVIKYGYIYDKDFLYFLRDNQQEILKLAPNIMLQVIARCCQIKAEVVSQDEQEAGLRAILNFGHTLAHSIETETHYTTFNHGEAVAIGMIGAAILSRKMGFIKQDTVAEMIDIIKTFNLPTRAKQLDVENVFSHLFHDKKTVGGTITWVLLDEVGKVSLHKDVPDDIIKSTIKELV